MRRFCGGFYLPLVGRSERASARSEEHTSELQSHSDLVCRLLLEKKKRTFIIHSRTASGCSYIIRLTIMRWASSCLGTRCWILRTATDGCGSTVSATWRSEKVGGL